MNICGEPKKYECRYNLGVFGNDGKKTFTKYLDHSMLFREGHFIFNGNLAIFCNVSLLIFDFCESNL